MSIRYPAVTLAIASAGAFMVVTTFTFSRGVSNGISLAIGIGAVVLALAMVASSLPSAHRSVHKSLGVLTALVGGWTILVAAGIFSGDLQEALIFASGIAISAAGALGHALNDVDVERRLEKVESGTGMPDPTLA